MTVLFFDFVEERLIDLFVCFQFGQQLCGCLTAALVLDLVDVFDELREFGGRRVVVVQTAAEGGRKKGGEAWWS